MQSPPVDFSENLNEIFEPLFIIVKLREEMIGIKRFDGLAAVARTNQLRLEQPLAGGITPTSTERMKRTNMRELILFKGFDASDQFSDHLLLTESFAVHHKACDAAFDGLFGFTGHVFHGLVTGLNLMIKRWRRKMTGTGRFQSDPARVKA